jgi:hypothetical protein
MNPKNILLVEGDADRGFFEALCENLQLAVQVKVCTPRDAGHLKDSKQAALAVLETTYLRDLADGHIERIAIVMDADQDANGGGFARTFAQLTQRLSPAGYQLRAESGSGGFLFGHDDGLNDLGAWLMPNNADDGMLEDWIQLNLHPQEAALMQHAKNSIDQIPGGPKFKPLRRSKAEVATWLAWQSEPDHGLWQAAKPDLLDDAAPQLQALKTWLMRVFPAN